MRHPTLSGSKCTCVQCWLLSLLTCHLRRSVASQVTFSATDTFPPLTKVLSFIGHKGICPYESSELGELWLGKLSIVIGPILKLISGVGWRKSKPVCCHCLSLRFCFLEASRASLRSWAGLELKPVLPRPPSAEFYRYELPHPLICHFLFPVPR